MKSIHVTGRFIVHQKLFILLLIGLLLLSASSEAAGPWKGQVVDRETRKPIEGAVVLFVWYKHYSLMDQIREYQDSEEFVTGADGRFMIPWKWTLNLFVFYNRPDIYIFKAGYGKWQFRDTEKYSKDTFEREKQFNAEWKQLTGEGAVLELPRVKTRDQKEQRLSLPILVPRDRIPKLREAVNKESEKLGLGIIYPK